MSGTNTVDPNTGNVTYEGDLEITPGNHNGMPSRTDAYLPGDERGHVNASSLNGSNKPDNVVAQDKDVNRHGYRAVERGETDALKSGATIHSTKTAFVDGKPGDRPSAFMVNDTITYTDGHVEHSYHSFTNAPYTGTVSQEAWNNTSASMPGTFDGPNPNDALRASMTPEEYAELMETTDPFLPGIQEDYQPTTHSTAPAAPAANTAAPAANTAVDTAVAADPAADAGTTAADAAVDAADSSADTSSDDGGSADASADGSSDGGADTSGGDGGCGADPD